MIWCGLANLLVFGSVMCTGGDAATTRPIQTGSVSGTVSASGAGLPEMIVFLEPTDPGVRFAPPTEPAVISQRGARFSPSLLVIAAGQAVDFRNDELRPVEHNVFSRSAAKQFDLGLYPPPEGRTVVFDIPGPVRLYCSIHRYMDGLIYVCPTPYFATVAADGSFVIRDAPAGNYLLRTWQHRARFQEHVASVRIEPGAVVTVNLEMRRE